MEGAAAIAYASLKAYWRRKNYHRLKDPPLEIRQTSQSLKPKNRKYWRRFRIHRTKLQLGRFNVRLGAVRKLFMKMRDAYVNAMLGIGISSSSGYGGFVVVGGGAKEYDEKMVAEIYRRIVLAQEQGHGQSVSARKHTCLFR